MKNKSPKEIGLIVSGIYILLILIQYLIFISGNYELIQYLSFITSIFNFIPNFVLGILYSTYNIIDPSIYNILVILLGAIETFFFGYFLGKIFMTSNNIEPNIDVIKEREYGKKIIWTSIIIIIVFDVLMRVFIGVDDGEGGLGLAIGLMVINAGYSCILVLMSIGMAISKNKNWKYFLAAALLCGIIGFGTCYMVFA